MYVMVAVSALAWTDKARAQYDCPAGSNLVTVGAGEWKCQCADGSFAGLSYGCRDAAQPQQPLCPAGTTYCEHVNLCCGSGNYCSKYGCTPLGAVDCGNHYCKPGEQCSRSGGCRPAGTVDCGAYYCQPGERCASNHRACLAQDDTDCGDYHCGAGYKCAIAARICVPKESVDCGLPTGASCPTGNKCSRDGKHCFSFDAIDCGPYSCPTGKKCGSSGQCLASNAVDCGGGKSCSTGYVCRRGGGCATRQQLAAEQAAENQRKQEEAARKVQEAEARRQEILRRAEQQREAARVKEEERQRQITQQKAQAEAKRIEQQRQQAEEHERTALAKKQAAEVEAQRKKLEAEQRATEAEAKRQAILKQKEQAAALAAEKAHNEQEQLAAAIKVAEEKKAAAQKLLEQQRALARLQKETKELEARVKAEQAATMKNTQAVTGSVVAKQAGQQTPARLDDKFFQAILNDPTQSLVSRRLAAAVLGKELPTAQTKEWVAGQNYPGNPTAMYQPTQAERELATAAFGIGKRPAVSSQPVTLDDQLRAAINDPKETVATRQIAAIALGIDPASVGAGSGVGSPAVAGNPAASGKPVSNPAASAMSNTGQDGAHLNPDLKTNIATLSPENAATLPIASNNAGKPLTTQATAPLQRPPLKTAPQYSLPVGTSASGCLSRATSEIRGGQISMPPVLQTLGSAATDAGKAAVGAMQNLPSLVNVFGYANDAARAASLAMQGDGYGLSAYGVTYGTVQAEGTLGNKIAPGVGSIAAGATQFLTDIGTAYASPVVTQYLFDCFPNFTPKSVTQTNININPFTGQPYTISK